jgi:DNA-binding CsgD family transcriptional regulator
MLTRDYEVPNRFPYSAPSHSREIGSASPFIPALAPDFTSVLETSSLLSALVETLPKGLIVLAADRTIVYWNQTAKRLCQKLSGTQRYWTMLPTSITELSDQLVDARVVYEPLLLDYQTPDGCSFRLTACWLRMAVGNEVNLAFNQQAYRLMTIEDRDETLQQDLQVEQKKFRLTNREAEVWLLLKQEYSYQAIAKTLHISLNTVKTHIRNIHTKRHPHQSLPA